jgi:collagenase-like PrtC family protease
MIYVCVGLVIVKDGLRELLVIGMKVGKVEVRVVKVDAIVRVTKVYTKLILAIRLVHLI